MVTQRSVLLLSSGFEPVTVISWQRAVTMLFAEKIEVIEQYEHSIRSISFSIRAPAVVRLLKYAPFSRGSPPLSRVNILARDEFECQYCGTELHTREATLDHIIPRSRGGRTTWENLVCCCKTCNRKKGGLLVDEARMRLLSIPKKPAWLPVIKVTLNGNIPPPWQAFLGAQSCGR